MRNGKILSYKEMLKIFSQYSICVIPTRRKKTTLCGLTSFCDAIALGMPILLTDTTHIDVDSEKEKFRYYYEAGNIKDLELEMHYFIDNSDKLEIMSEISRKYAERNDYAKSTTIICNIIFNN